MTFVQRAPPPSQSPTLQSIMIDRCIFFGAPSPYRERKVASRRRAGKGGAKRSPRSGDLSSGTDDDGDMGAELDSASVVERVTKMLEFQPPGGGPPVTRSVAQLSGGERMRVSLCLALGLMDLLG